jgi:hypothetical protein
MSFLRTSLLCLSLVLVSAVTLFAAEAPSIEIEKRAHWGIGWDVEVLELDPDATPNAEMILRIENLSGDFLRAAQFSVTLVTEDDDVRAFVQFVVPVEIDRREVRHVARTLYLPEFQPGDRLIVQPDVLLHRGRQGIVFEKVGPAQCSTYCDRCSDKAIEACTHGVASSSCTCKQDEYTCLYTCNVPSK